MTKECGVPKKFSVIGNWSFGCRRCPSQEPRRNSLVITLALLAFLIIAAVTDVSRRKIYNWTTYPGIIAGILLNGILQGSGGLEASVAGFLACGAIMLFCFVLFRLGGGDVKLVAMMGAFLGLQDGIEAMLWTFILGAIAGVAVLIWRVRFLTLVKQGLQHLWLVVRSRSWVPLPDEQREPLRSRLYLAPMSAVAVGIVRFGPLLLD